MKEKNDRSMNLPDKEYYSIEEVATNLSSKAGKTIRTRYLFDYIKQGILPAYIHHNNTYSLVKKSQLATFANHAGGKAPSDIFLSEPFEQSASNLHGWTFNPSEDNVYIKHEDLNKFVKKHNDNGSETQKKENDKPLKTKERKSLHLIIAALVELAELDIEKPYQAAKDIMCKAKESNYISENTIVNHLRDAQDTVNKLA